MQSSRSRSCELTAVWLVMSVLITAGCGGGDGQMVSASPTPETLIGELLFPPLPPDRPFTPSNSNATVAPFLSGQGVFVDLAEIIVPLPTPQRWYGFGVPLEPVMTAVGFPPDPASVLWSWTRSPDDAGGRWQARSVVSLDPPHDFQAGQGYFYFTAAAAPITLAFRGTVPPTTERTISLVGRGWHLVALPLPAGQLIQSLDLSSNGVRVMLPDGLTKDGSGAFPFLFHFGFRLNPDSGTYVAVDLEADRVDPLAAYWLYSLEENLTLHLPATGD